MTQLRELMTLDITHTQPSATVYEVAKKLKEEQVGTLPVCNESGELIGIVTDRDLVISSIAERKPNTTAIQEIMSSEPITATADMSIEQASKLMKKHQIRRLPVVSQNKLIGMLSLGDLARQKQTKAYSQAILQEVSQPATTSKGKSWLTSRSGKITTLVTGLVAAGASILSFRKRKAVSL